MNGQNAEQKGHLEDRLAIADKALFQLKKENLEYTEVMKEYLRLMFPLTYGGKDETTSYL